MLSFLFWDWEKWTFSAPSHPPMAFRCEYLIEPPGIIWPSGTIEPEHNIDPKSQPKKIKLIYLCKISPHPPRMAWNMIVKLRADGLNWRRQQSISLVLETPFILINWHEGCGRSQCTWSEATPTQGQHTNSTLTQLGAFLLRATWKQTSAAIWCVTAETAPQRPLLGLHHNSGHSVGSGTSTSLLLNLQPISSRQEAQKNK